MSFKIDSISFKVGEVAIPVVDLCSSLGRDYTRLIKRSGFEYVHHTKESELKFFGDFLSETIKVQKGDFIIFVNQSMSTSIPGGISELFLEISNVDATGFLELSDGCTGFSRAIVVANSLLESGTALRCHIICAEKYSKFFDDQDESVAPIFSDAISLTTISQTGPYKILNSITRNFFSRRDSISVSKDFENIDKIKMDGAQVLSWAVNEIPKVVDQLLVENNLKVENIDTWLIHQGSKIVVESLAEHIGIDPERKFTASQLGNTVSSSIPIILSQSFEGPANNYIPNGYVMILTFGVGLSIVGILLKVDS
jgi:3-oxoacyl-[acyl-carrier-protein] synthase-3